MTAPRRPPRRRALGQHFLVDETVAERMVELAGVASGTPVLEIGPGRGALTERLLAGGCRVFAVELDPELAEALAARSDPWLTVVCQDFLRLPLASVPSGPCAVVANLPYASGTAILERLLEEARRFDPIVVMLQREVAERVCAVPGSRSYGALSVLTALRGRARLAFRVPPEAFRPRPRVESAALRIDAHRRPPIAPDVEARFRRVVRTAFAQRRKTLRNALAAGFGRDAAAAALERAGIAGARRAETLSFDEFARLAESFRELPLGPASRRVRGAGVREA